MHHCFRHPGDRNKTMPCFLYGRSDLVSYYGGILITLLFRFSGVILSVKWHKTRGCMARRRLGPPTTTRVSFFRNDGALSPRTSIIPVTLFNPQPRFDREGNLPWAMLCGFACTSVCGRRQQVTDGQTPRPPQDCLSVRHKRCQVTRTCSHSAEKCRHIAIVRRDL